MGEKGQSGAERRRDPRFDRSFVFHVGQDSEGLRAESINISTRGLYCKVSRYVKPFSKLRLALELPFTTRRSAKVECEGVVVRVEPDAETSESREYRVAVYFLNLDIGTAGLIADFLSETH